MSKRRTRSDRRAVPDDFAALAPTMSATALFKHYRTSAAAIRRWKRETGIATIGYRPPTPEKRPVPVDFAERAPTTTTRALARHYRTGFRIVVRWAQEAGVEPMRGTRQDARPVPEDFTELAPTMYATRLAAHYGASHEMVARWARLTGVAPPKAPPGRPRDKKAAVTRGPVRLAANRGFDGPKSAFITRLSRDDSLEGRAADHLRRYAAVYRCTETGRADQHGAWWRYGSVVIDAGELIERAMRKGWVPDAWAVVATQAEGARV